MTINAQIKPLSGEDIEQLNAYKSVETALQNPTDVEALFLNHAKLNEIPEEVTQFKNMIVLGLGENSISEIPDFVFRLEKLQHLGCSHNNISFIPEGISGLKDLTTFKCWNNQISTVPVALLSLPNIQIIELKGNNIPKAEQKKLRKEYPNISFLF